MKINVTLAIFGLALSSYLSEPSAAADLQVAPRFGTAFETVFSWRQDHCELWDVPDAPLRAFKTTDGSVVAFASSPDNMPLRGSNLDELHHDCRSALRSVENADPSLYSGLRYITATWTEDGKHVFALIHNEYHADHFKSCLEIGGLACWYTTILAASSENNGGDFAVSSPPVVVAGIPTKQDVEQGRHRGFFNPSNIIRLKNYWYMLTDTTGIGDQRAGLCLFRTANIDDPRSWSGWDGAGFGARAIDAYRDDPSRYVPCKPVDYLQTIGSISLHKPSGRFLAVVQGPDSTHKNGQIGYSWSDDLIHWSKPKAALEVSDMSSKDCSDQVRYGYPSVLDPSADGRNFDTIGADPYLYLTLFHIEGCGMPPNRDLVRIKLHIGA